jgi:hypothetical protein
VRILVSCLQSLRRHDIPACGFWREYFLQGCREAGIEPLEVPGVDWAEGLTYREGTADLESWKNRTWEKTLSFVREEQSRGGVDFFLGYFYPQQVEVAAIKELQRTGIPCVNFFCDNVREFRRVPKAYRPFDLHWVPEYEALPMYRQARLPHIHAAMPCWIPKHLRVLPKKEEGPAVFIGSADILRRNLFSEAIAAGADLALHGKGWIQSSGEAAPFRAKKDGFLATQTAFLRRHGLHGVRSKIVDKLFPLPERGIPQSSVGHLLSPEDYVRVTKEAPVVLGASRVPSPARSLRNPLKYSRLRDIEAPMFGACYLTEHTEGLASLYNVGEDVESFSSADELASKLKELMSDSEKRRRLRIAGQQRALSEHSVPATLAKIGFRLGSPLKPKSDPTTQNQTYRP